jgi:hypothetical protein
MQFVSISSARRELPPTVVLSIKSTRCPTEANAAGLPQIDAPSLLALNGAARAFALGELASLAVFCLHDESVTNWQLDGVRKMLEDAPSNCQQSKKLERNKVTGQSQGN